MERQTALEEIKGIEATKGIAADEKIRRANLIFNTIDTSRMRNEEKNYLMDYRIHMIDRLRIKSKKWNR